MSKITPELVAELIVGRHCVMPITLNDEDRANNRAVIVYYTLLGEMSTGKELNGRFWADFKQTKSYEGFMIALSCMVRDIEGAKLGEKIDQELPPNPSYDILDITMGTKIKTGFPSYDAATRWANYNGVANYYVY